MLRVLLQVSVEATESPQVLTSIPWSVEMKAYKTKFNVERKMSAHNDELQNASPYSYFTKARAQNRQRRRAITKEGVAGTAADEAGGAAAAAAAAMNLMIDNTPRQRSNTTTSDSVQMPSKNTATDATVAAADTEATITSRAGDDQGNVYKTDTGGSKNSAHDNWIIPPVNFPSADDDDAVSEAHSLNDHVFGAGKPKAPISKLMAMRPTRMALLSMRRHDAAAARHQARAQRNESSRHTQGGLMRSVSEGYPLEKQHEMDLDEQFEKMLSSLKTPYAFGLDTEGDIDAETDVDDDESLYPVSNGETAPITAPIDTDGNTSVAEPSSANFGAPDNNAANAVAWVLETILDLTAEVAAVATVDERSAAKQLFEERLAVGVQARRDAMQMQMRMRITDVDHQADAQVALAAVMDVDCDRRGDSATLDKLNRARTMARASFHMARLEDEEAFAAGRTVSLRRNAKKQGAFKSPFVPSATNLSNGEASPLPPALRVSSSVGVMRKEDPDNGNSNVTAKNTAKVNIEELECSFPSAISNITGDRGTIFFTPQSERRSKAVFPLSGSPPSFAPGSDGDVGAANALLQLKDGDALQGTATGLGERGKSLPYMMRADMLDELKSKVALDERGMSLPYILRSNVLDELKGKVAKRTPSLFDLNLI